MTKLKNEVNDRLDNFWHKNQKLFNRLLSQTDEVIAKTLHLLKEKRVDFDEYIKKRDKLSNELTEKEAEITRLQNYINKLNNEQKDEMFHIYERFHLRSDELLTLQHKYFTARKDINNFRKKIDKLNNEKEKIIPERNWLKIEHDHLQGVLKENDTSVATLKEQLLDLKNKQSNSNDTGTLQQKIVEKENEINILTNERSLLQHKINELRPSLLKKMKDLTRITNELEKIKEQINEKYKQIDKLQLTIAEQSEKLVKHKHENQIVVHQFEKEKQKIKAYEEKLKKEKNDVAILKNLLVEADKEYKASVEKRDNIINKLNEQLVDTKNNFVMTDECQEKPVSVSVEALKVLNEENKLRFNQLYKNCVFMPSFFADYFSMGIRQRMEVEEYIAKLNFDYEKSIVNEREHTITVKNGIIIEIPFGNTGKIYIDRNNEGKVIFHRISTTKNGKGNLNQQKVINWLKRNL
ncbi:MAG TPA: hypothetical protein VK056_01220 [Bacillota bacterium]|nr:hypothetical protein [Bacillota bacterium]